MENLSNVDAPNEKPHPKPTDDPGAEIETVTPDSQKESLPNDQCIPQGNTTGESATDSEVKVDKTPKGQQNSKKSEHAEIETVTPDTENKDLLDDRESAPEDRISRQETDEEDNDTTSEDPEISQNKNNEDGTGIETVTP